MEDKTESETKLNRFAALPPKPCGIFIRFFAGVIPWRNEAALRRQQTDDKIFNSREETQPRAVVPHDPL